jgi:hypothetical protein
MKCLKTIDARIVTFGMSCVGKTTFAKELLAHSYCCFDALFQWHLIETLGMSVEANLGYVRDKCDELDCFVMDGWTLADQKGQFLPQDTRVYVIYAPYEQILSQYRIPVLDHEEFRPMFKKWYLDIDYDLFPATRYFLNAGEFVETTKDDFMRSLSECNQ